MPSDVILQPNTFEKQLGKRLKTAPISRLEHISDDIKITCPLLLTDIESQYPPHPP